MQLTAAHRAVVGRSFLRERWSIDRSPSSQSLLCPRPTWRCRALATAGTAVTRRDIAVRSDWWGTSRRGSRLRFVGACSALSPSLRGQVSDAVCSTPDQQQGHTAGGGIQAQLDPRCIPLSFSHRSSKLREGTLPSPGPARPGDHECL